MFGLSLRCQLFQGPAVRTWNCVTNFANLLWYKFYHIGEPIMPRPRRRHHSRSRTRSRSNSLERTRDPKRRKIDSYDESHKRSLSSEHASRETTIKEEIHHKLEIAPELSASDSKSETTFSTTSQEHDCDSDNSKSESKQKKLISKVGTPNKSLTPKQLQKKLESEKRREEKEMEREKIKQEKEEIRKKVQDEKEKEKREKQEQKQKELEEKQKEKDMKEEKKKKEREEKDLKRKEKEEKIEQKRKELEEKSKEKLKLEEKQQKVSNAFKNFFKKKSENAEDRRGGGDAPSSIFMPFEVKSDMRLAPTVRNSLSDSQREALTMHLKEQNEKRTYLEELKLGKTIGKSSKTWVDEDDDVVLMDCDLGESILEQSKTSNNMKAKFLKFDENRRPPYSGTWRKKSKFITPRTPFSKDSDYFDYSVDSDDDWEEEDPGESIRGSDDEDKENESENEYDEDNEFLVPHGHLSDDEVNDEENAIINPEDHKAKLKLLKKEFEDEMKEKTQRIKPRVIGCIWYNKNEDNVDEVIRNFFEPLSIISNGPVVIKKRSDFKLQTPMRVSHIPNPLSADLIPEFLKFIHGRTSSSKSLVKEFLNYLRDKNINCDTSQTSLNKQMKKFAVWERCLEEGSMYNKFCWCVRNEVKQEYKVEPIIS